MQCRPIWIVSKTKRKLSQLPLPFSTLPETADTMEYSSTSLRRSGICARAGVDLLLLHLLLLSKLVFLWIALVRSMSPLPALCRKFEGWFRWGEWSFTRWWDRGFIIDRFRGSPYSCRQLDWQCSCRRPYARMTITVPHRSVQMFRYQNQSTFCTVRTYCQRCSCTILIQGTIAARIYPSQVFLDASYCRIY